MLFAGEQSSSVSSLSLTSCAKGSAQLCQGRCTVVPTSLAQYKTAVLTVYLLSLNVN